MESPLIKFSQAIKYSTKNDSLEGDFLLQVRTFEVEFEGGTSWNDDWGGPKPGDRGEPWKGATESERIQEIEADRSIWKPFSLPGKG